MYIIAHYYIKVNSIKSFIYKHLFKKRHTSRKSVPSTACKRYFLFYLIFPRIKTSIDVDFVQSTIGVSREKISSCYSLH